MAVGSGLCVVMAPMMAALGLGIAKYRPPLRRRLVLLCALLMIVPGLIFSGLHLKTLWTQNEDAGTVRGFIKDHVSAEDVVVTDYALSAVFAHRNQIFVYYKPPQGMAGPEMFLRSNVAVIHKSIAEAVEAAQFRPMGIDQGWRLVTESPNYRFYKKAF